MPTRPAPRTPPTNDRAGSIQFLMLFAGLLLLGFAITTLGDFESDETAHSDNRESRVGLYSRALEEARRAWQNRDGFMTTLVVDPEVLEISWWKTWDRRDDGSPGIAPIVRTRRPGGTLVLVIQGPMHVKDISMWKITDGEIFGWVSNLMLDSLPP